MRWLLALALATPAWAQEAPSFGGPYVLTEQGGAAIYRWVCAGCHMPDGRGAAGAGAYPALAGDVRAAAWPYVAAVVLRGQRGMPGFGWLLTDAQVADVVGYVGRRFGGSEAAGPSAEEVAGVRKGK